MRLRRPAAGFLSGLASRVRRGPLGSRPGRSAAAFLLGVALLALSGCGTRTPYFLIESRLVQSNRHAGEPDVTETPAFRGLRGGIRTLGLQPPDVCADQGLSRSSGSGDPRLGVLRTRCGVEMAELERALARAGYRVVSWGAIHHLASRQEKPVLEAAGELDVDVLLQVNALERVELQPGRDARFERRFYRADRAGGRTDPARVTPARRSEFEALVARRESRLVTGKRVGATINVSAVQVSSGATVWFYEWTRIDEVAAEPVIEILAECDDAGCAEVREREPVESDGLVEGSISGISLAGDPEDESQAIFQELVRELVTDLAERFAGRRS